jgi:hypothetical protein
MRWLFRPSILILLSVVLVVGAAALVLWPRAQGIHAAPLGDNEWEVVWLYPATSESSWERFVSAVGRAVDRLQAACPGVEVVISDDTFPRHTTSHPEVAVKVRGGSARLVFRWYKLASDQNADQWVAALLGASRRRRLAIVGGSSSEQAREIALSLRDRAGSMPNAPLLLLTTATADRVAVSEAPGDVPLNELHREHTFRFCFTNRQMAEAVTAFIATRDELRPDSGPFYVAQWEDDAYSRDLTERFCDAVRGRLDRPSSGPGGQFQNPVAEFIDYSVGGFDQPNRWEAPAVEHLMKEKIEKHARQERPLLVLAAPSSQPARRFLRGLARTSPAEARHFAVVTGDALSFNTVYRDRNVAWPVQDLPFDLVFFCHRNPIDPDAGFLREDAPSAGIPAPATGTEDLLLYMDIVEALVQAVSRGGAMPAGGDELGERLRPARWHDGRVSVGEEGPALFDPDGNRRGGTGEHVVWLRPDVQKDRQERQPPRPAVRVLPHAAIKVYELGGPPEEGGSWRALPELRVDYHEAGMDR